LELSTAVKDDNLRQPEVSSDAISHNHHAGSIAGFVKRQIKGKATARKGIDQYGHPRPAEWSTGMRTDNFYIQLCVVYLANLKRAVTMTRSRRFQFEIEGRVSVRGTSSSSLQCLLKYGAPVYRGAKRYV
jgi:hypothetical protein